MKLFLYYHTVRDLRPLQVFYRLPVLKRIGRSVSTEVLDVTRAGRVDGWVPSIPSYSSCKDGKTFKFLSREYTFEGGIDWDFKDYGLLWTYNLNYFEFLEQPDMDIKTGYSLIDHFLLQYPEIKIGHDPYPISLRLIFWIRFFIRQHAQPAEKYLAALHMQAKELQGKLEYHLLGNHLLENAYALFFSGVYLRDGMMILQAKRLLQKQLDEQILKDGGHFELSPMYHQIMLYRLLDVINIARACEMGVVKDSLSFLEGSASMMLGWMQQMCFWDGSFPLFNDAAYGIAPTPQMINEYAKDLDVTPEWSPLNDSGYRRWNGRNWEMIMDVGQPGPSYQPGHAHCDALSFALQVNGKPILVDTGTSIYGGDAERRMTERGTASHNTVQIGDLEQSEIWGDFRMARKAKVSISREDENHIEASHNGFFFGKSLHRRTFNRMDKSIIIDDEIINARGDLNKARFHFHPDITLKETSNKEIDHSFCFGQGRIRFKHVDHVESFSYDYAPYFGRTIKATGLMIAFAKKLTTEINLEDIA